jgi:hypothetical protein
MKAISFVYLSLFSNAALSFDLSCKDCMNEPGAHFCLSDSDFT